MKKNILAAVIIVVVLAVGGFALFHKSSKPTPNNPATKNSAVVITKTDSTVGKYLADPTGKALYTYGGDTAGVSNCTGSCLANWPAYQATASVANLPAGVSTIKRSDNGQTQYTYNGMPLYYFVSDGAGKVTGNGVENFSVAVPKAATSTNPSSSDSTQSQTNNSSSSSSYPY